MCDYLSPNCEHDCYNFERNLICLSNNFRKMIWQIKYHSQIGEMKEKDEIITFTEN